MAVATPAARPFGVVWVRGLADAAQPSNVSAITIRTTAACRVAVCFPPRTKGAV